MFSRGKMLVNLAKKSEVKEYDEDSDSDDNLFSDDTDVDPDYEPIVFDRSKKQKFIESDFEESDESVTNDTIYQQNAVDSSTQHTNNADKETVYDMSNDNDLVWGDFINEPESFPTDIPPPLNNDVLNNICNSSPEEVYALLVDNDIIDYLVLETNRYASQKINQEQISSGSRLKKWRDTDRVEMMNFFGIVMWIGLVKMPNLACYWSENLLYANKVSDIMSRNRFEILLRMFHAANNETESQGGRLYKVQPLIDRILPKYQNIIIPQEDICIDETIIPWRGRLKFRQYVPNKRHRYGVKVFKLCLTSGYTWNIKVYAGKEATSGVSVPQKVVMDLIDPLLHAGRTLYCDNWYTSIPLATTLMESSTHLVGTLRGNRRGNPKNVVKAKLKTGQTISAQSNTKIGVIKWQDRREVLMLSTKHKDQLLSVSKRGKEVMKPKAVLDYNKAKSFIDLSDQMSSYSTTLRRTIKWYRKIIFELLFGTSVVNALVLYNMANKSTRPVMKIVKFRELVTHHLLQARKPEPAVEIPLPDNQQHVHRIVSVEGPVKTVRRRCSGCYKRLRSSETRQDAAKRVKRVTTKCSECNIFVCVDCFSDQHVLAPK